MVFSSFPFLWIFLPVVLIGAILTQKRGGNLFLLVMSLLFYAWGEPKYIVLLLLSIVMNYGCGLLIDRAQEPIVRKLLTAAGIVLNLLLLGYFKYYNFFAEALNSVLHAEAVALKRIALPVGISFYTFQSISYLFDLYRGTIEVQRSFTDLALYISFFPQLVAGPIVKYKDIIPFLHHRQLTLKQSASGLKRFCFGLGKKVLFANALGYTVDGILSHPVHELSGILCWTAAIFYTLQIYFDFSGYSDMAIGLAEVLGFRFRENFDLPYSAGSIREFWRRWHISLSTWFRDYLYIPLGGNRKGSVRTILNLLIVFFATGLWHGAQWNFVLWGLYHGFFLIAERVNPFSGRFSGKLADILKHIYTMFVVCIGWVLFRADDITMAGSQLRQMFLPSGNGYWNVTEFVDPVTFAIFIISLIGALGLWRKITEKCGKFNKAAEICSGTAAIVCLFLSIVMLANASHNPFIYFRF